MSVHSMRDERLAWIMGSSRSGSTWLTRMLRDTGEVATIDDPHLGHHLGTWRPISLAYATAERDPELTTLREVKRDNPDYFFSDRYAHAWGPALQRLISDRFQAQADEAGFGASAPIVVKEPASQVAELLLELFGGSKLIFLLRDGRDVVDSWLDAYRRGSWAQSGGAFAAEAGKREPLIRWLAHVWVHRTDAVHRAYASRRPQDRVLVRYENLLSAPEEELARVARLLGISSSAHRLHEIASARDFDLVQPDERGVGRAVRRAAPGGWRHSLTRSERRALLDVLGPKLRELGYERAPLAA
jgi:hypothetical protein